jgi:hypothetical protein
MGFLNFMKPKKPNNSKKPINLNISNQPINLNISNQFPQRNSISNNKINESNMRTKMNKYKKKLNDSGLSKNTKEYKNKVNTYEKNLKIKQKSNDRLMVVRMKQKFNNNIEHYKKILNTLELNKNSNIYKNKVNAYKKYLNLEAEKYLLNERSKLLKNSYSNLLQTPDVSTLYMTREMLKKLKDLNEKIRSNEIYKGYLMLKNQNPRLKSVINIIKKTHTHKVKIIGIVYSKTEDKYYHVYIVLNENNKIDIYKINFYNDFNMSNKIYSDIELTSNVSNMSNMNNVILSNGEKVKVLIVSPKKYFLVEELVKSSY